MADPTHVTQVSLTMPLSTFLGLSDQPARLDGHGPAVDVVAGLARRIAQDAARDHPTFTTWRCVVVDDTHGSVLGVTEPIRTPRYTPPPRLQHLVHAMEPTCVFPGCRRAARGCDLDHRIPYDPADRDRPPGHARGGATCSCNLQPLCRGHHQLKTRGLVHVRALPPGEDPHAVPGTLEWTLPSGYTLRTAPTVIDAGPLIDPTHPTGGASAADVDADVRAALVHIAAREAEHTTRTARLDADHPDHDDPDSTDWAGDLWHRTRTAHARDAATTTSETADEPPPF